MNRSSRLALLKQVAVEQGYRLEVGDDGTERLYRPDGTLALTAEPNRSGKLQLVDRHQRNVLVGE